MKRYLFIGCLLLGCSKEDKKPQEVPSVSLPAITTTQVPPSGPINVLAGGQSNMTLRDNSGTAGVPSYFCEDIKLECKWLDTAVGGSSQQEWVIGGTYYNNLIAKGRSMGHIDVLLWWQGEAETAAGDLALAGDWGYHFTQMIAAIRQDLNQPNLLVVFAQIGTNPGDPGLTTGMSGAWNEVQRQQSLIFIPNAYMVWTKDQNFFGWVHTDEIGYRIVAQRMATVFLQNKP